MSISKTHIPSNNINSSKRIPAIDGLRAIAVVGVIWVHTWDFSGNPVWSIGKIGSINLDLNRAISVIGTGVDLFFVLSGFCMYLKYAHKQQSFKINYYWYFVKKCWLRIAPAFYIAAIVCAIGHIFIGLSFPWQDLLSHFTFTNIWWSNTNKLAPPFWSLSTQWSFYLILPLLILAIYKSGFKRVAIIAIICSIVFRLWMYSSSLDIQYFWGRQLPSRLGEFILGMGIARLYVLKKSLPKILKYEQGFLIGFIMTYIGRILMVTELVKMSGSVGFIFQTLAHPVVSLGYSIILWNVISSESIFQKLLSHQLFQVIGRWSYSLYLWHYWLSFLIVEYLVNSFGESTIILNASLFISLVILIPISWWSYYYLETPYFRWKK